MNKNNKIYILIICILILVIVAMGIIMKKLYNDSNNQSNEIEQTETQVDTTENDNNDTLSTYKIEDFYGEYKWKKDYIGGVNNVELTYNVELKLNSDGTASFSASDGMASDKTTGIYVLEDNKIIYTKKHYNYGNGTENEDISGENIIVTFDIVDKNTLKTNYHDQIAELKK